MSDSSSINELGQQIHRALAAQLLARIESGEATSADLNVARQFLKDNGIDSLLYVNEEEPATKLAALLPFKDPEAGQRVG